MSEPIYGPKKNRQEASLNFDRRYPHHHQNYFHRPDVSRRQFFQLTGAGLAGSWLTGNALAQGPGGEIVTATGAETYGTANSCIFVFLVGAISQMDSFDLKVTADTPATLDATMVNGIHWPMGLLPKLSGHLDDLSIIRSMSAWALVHPLAQTWTQIGRNPAAALGDIAPNMGSVVAIEQEASRLPDQVFPTFVALNSRAAAGPGYFSSTYAPFHVVQGRDGSSSIPNTVNPIDPNGEGLFDFLYARMQQYDGALRAGAPFGEQAASIGPLYDFARNMMYNDAVEQAFALSEADRIRYGDSSFGNACAIARQVVTADQGTRFVQINYGNWDHHADIYGLEGGQNNIFGMSPDLDNGLSALLEDLKAEGRLKDTMVVVVGEFGRTPRISAANGRDHYLLQSALIAGGGVQGGRVIGATNEDGSEVTDFGWAGSGATGPRYVRPEDMESTILSALGIDWTTTRYDDPFQRGFEYVPFAKDGIYGPIHELFV